MSDYISRQAAIDEFEKELSAKYKRRELAIGFVGVKSILDNLPSADVRENVRGKWISIYTFNNNPYDRTGIWCSACGKDALQDSEGYYIEDCKTDFCPHCGADLRGGQP